MANPVQCIFLDGENCSAQPTHRFGYYKPDEEVLKVWCLTEEFADCPRCQMYLEYLKLSQGEIHQT